MISKMGKNGEHLKDNMSIQIDEIASLVNNFYAHQNISLGFEKLE